MQSFGTKLSGQSYRVRPGAYGIIVNQDQLICLINAPSGYTLPGGGAHSEDEMVDTLDREVLEETGFKIRILKEIGIAEQFLHALGEGYFRKVCHYYLCLFEGLISTDSEADHEVLWCTQLEALQLIKNESSHGWALRAGIRVLQGPRQLP